MSDRDNQPEPCADCGTGYWPGRFDVAPFLCDDCYQSRGRWADEQEAKMLARKMAKATLDAIQHQRKDVA